MVEWGGGTESEAAQWATTTTRLDDFRPLLPAEEEVVAKFRNGSFDRLGDVLAMWDIRRARATAWVNGEALWALRNEAELRAEFLLALDRLTGVGSRGLLIPADTVLNRTDRRLRRMRRDPLWWA